jgi:hypothetical protein
MVKGHPFFIIRRIVLLAWSHFPACAAESPQPAGDQPSVKVVKQVLSRNLAPNKKRPAKAAGLFHWFKLQLRIGRSRLSADPWSDPFSCLDQRRA